MSILTYLIRIRFIRTLNVAKVNLMLESLVIVDPAVVNMYLGPVDRVCLTMGIGFQG